MAVQAPPIQHPVIDPKTLLPTIPWALFFDGQFKGDLGAPWSPSFTNLTISGTPTITGKFYKITSGLAYFSVNIVPATNTSSTAGSTYINNFPLTMTDDGVCFAVSGLLGTNAGMCDRNSGNIYVPTWSAVTVPLTIVGIVGAS